MDVVPAAQRSSWSSFLKACVFLVHKLPRAQLNYQHRRRLRRSLGPHRSSLYPLSHFSHRVSRYISLLYLSPFFLLTVLVQPTGASVPTSLPLLQMPPMPRLVLWLSFAGSSCAFPFFLFFPIHFHVQSTLKDQYTSRNEVMGSEKKYFSIRSFSPSNCFISGPSTPFSESTSLPFSPHPISTL